MDKYEIPKDRLNELSELLDEEYTIEYCIPNLSLIRVRYPDDNHPVKFHPLDPEKEFVLASKIYSPEKAKEHTLPIASIEGRGPYEIRPVNTEYSELNNYHVHLDDVIIEFLNNYK